MKQTRKRRRDFNYVKRVGVYLTMSIKIRNKVSQYSTPLAVSLHKPQRITMKHKVQSCKVFAGRYYVFV